jgi:hypothetical protein
MPVNIAVLQRLDEELLYAVLDVSLDIQNCIDSGTDPIHIRFVRKVIRYPILFPANTPGAHERYSELRWNASGFLKKQGLILDHYSAENHHWDGVIQIYKPLENEIVALIPELRAEINRRNVNQAFNTDNAAALQHVLQLADTFHREALALRNRQHNRPDFLIQNEYDVQDLYHALLLTRFQTVRREEYGPSYAGTSTRSDFYLKEDSIVLEMKMSREGLNDKKLGEELINDIAHYKQRGCKAMFCFVYDPEHKLKNPAVLEADLSKPTDGMDVKVIIRPRQ